MTPDAHGQRGNHVASVNQLSRRTNPIHYLTGVFLMRSEMVIFCIMIIDMIIQTGLLDLLLYFIITSYSCPEAAVQSQIITPPSCVVVYINFIYAASVMIEIILVLQKPRVWTPNRQQGWGNLPFNRKKPLPGPGWGLALASCKSTRSWCQSRVPASSLSRTWVMNSDFTWAKRETHTSLATDVGSFVTSSC